MLQVQFRPKCVVTRCTCAAKFLDLAKIKEVEPAQYFQKLLKFRLICEEVHGYPSKNILRKGDPITSYLCSGGLIRGAYHNILKFNYNLYSSSLDVYQKRCVLYKLLISLRCMNESPTVAACVSTGSRRCVYKSFSLSRFILILVDCY